MRRTVIIRCLLVSVVISILAAFFSTTVYVAPAEGSMQPDLSALEEVLLEQTESDQLNASLSAVPMRKIEGLERFTYPMSHPEYIGSLISAFFLWLVGLFSATLIVSYLNEKTT